MDEGRKGETREEGHSFMVVYRLVMLRGCAKGIIPRGGVRERGRPFHFPLPDSPFLSLSLAGAGRGWIDWLAGQGHSAPLACSALLAEQLCPLRCAGRGQEGLDGLGGSWRTRQPQTGGQRKNVGEKVKEIHMKGIYSNERRRK